MEIFNKSKRNFFIFIFLLIVFFVLLSNMRLDKLILVESVIRPQTDIKFIQHLEGGIVNSILISEGDRVRAGQILVELVDLENKADVKSIDLTLKTLSIENLRYQALNTGQTPAFGDIEDSRNELVKIVAEQKKAFLNDKTQHETELKNIEIDIMERQAKRAEIRARLSNAEDSLKLIEEQLEINKDLEKEKIVSRIEIIKILRDKSSLVSRIQEDKNIVKGLEAKLKRLRNERKFIVTKFYSENQNKYNKNVKEILKLKESLLKANARKNRSQIKSPFDGIVKRILVKSTEDVVKPGQTLMEIIPGDDELLGEGFLSPSDRGFVKKDMPVLVRVSGVDGFKYSSIDGSVGFLSSDAVNMKGAGLSFKVRVKIKQKAFVNRLNRTTLELFPGMRVSTAIKIGEQSLWEYLLRPISSQFHYAFSER